MKKKRPGPLSLISIFLASFLIFYFLPPLFIRIPPVASFFGILGSYNAGLHAEILEVFGIKATTVSNILYLPSGSGVEYSPYCFGFLTIVGFAVLVFAVPSLHLKDRLKWIAWASLLLFMVNQGRIIFELLLASTWPLSLSTVDKLLYPLLPGVALIEWHRGLNGRVAFPLRGGGHARG